MSKRPKVPVSTRALTQRINRRLGEWERLKKSRGRAVYDLGEWYILDVNRNWIVEHNVHLEELGRRVEALTPWEYWEEAEDE